MYRSFPESNGALVNARRVTLGDEVDQTQSGGQGLLSAEGPVNESCSVVRPRAGLPRAGPVVAVTGCVLSGALGVIHTV